MNSSDISNDTDTQGLLAPTELSGEENDVLLQEDLEYRERNKLADEILEREFSEGIVQQPYIKVKEDEVVDSFDHLFPTAAEVDEEF